MKDYLTLNNEVLNEYNKTGKINKEKDREATRLYFLNEINMRTVFFHNLREKLDYLIENEYYEKEFLEQYDFEFIKEIFNIAYSYKFRFPSFMSASKFYNNYALKTRDDKNYLERYEDRIAVSALYMAQGDKEKAKRNVKAIMEAYQPATPTFANLGKSARGEFVSCFELLVDDSMDNISHRIGNSLELSRLGGGVGLSLTDLRCAGDPIKGIENRASGIIPVAKLLEDSFNYANQQGVRKGSGVIYLNIFHGDIESFISSKKPNADEKVRLATLSTGVVIPDIFFKLVEQDKDMYLFSPYDIKKVYGKSMSEISMTEMYYKLLDNPDIRKLKKLSARQLYTDIKKSQFESGYPFEMFDDNVNNNHPLKKIGRVKQSNLCVTGDTKLLTDQGYRTAKELYELQEELNVVIDNRTTNMNAVNKGTKTVKAIPMQLTAKDADVYKIKTKHGYEIKATSWHKFYKENDGDVVKVPLNKLKTGDKLLVQSGEGEYGTNSDVELAYIMGVIAGDGCITDKCAKIYLYDNKKVLAPTIEKYLANIISRYKVDRVYKHNTIFNPTFSGDEVRLQLSSTPLKDILSNFGMNKETKLTIPQYILNGTKAVQGAYLSGLYQMDGTVNANIDCKAMSFELTSISKDLVQGIQLLLLNMNVFTTIYEKAAGKSLMPDGHGGNKYFDVKKAYKINVQDRQSRENFLKAIELKKYDQEKISMFNSRNPKHNFTSEIVSIEYAGKEDVYDTTQEDYHSLIFNGIVTGNCSEILQLQEPTTINPYNVEDEIGMDVSCNLGSLDIHSSTKSKKFNELIKASMEMLVAVSDMSAIDNVPSVARANRLTHSVGLGVMNLHGHLIDNNILYGGKESINFVDIYFTALNYYTIKASMEIAKERGVKFYRFEESDYADGSYFEKYYGVELEVISDKVKEALGNVPIITESMWKELSEDVQRYGMYTAYRLATAPTGSISYIRSCTASLAPITEKVEVRDYQDSRTIYPMPFLTEENSEIYKEAYDINMFNLIDLYAAAQKHVDQGISMTLYIRDTWDTEQLAKVYLYAWKKGIKTVYYVRQRNTTVEECLSCSI